MQQDHIEDALNYFYTQLYSLRDKYIPRKSLSSKKHPPWYNSSLKKVLKEKSKYHRKYKTYGNISDYQSFSLLRDRAKKLESQCYSTYINKIENSIQHNPKSFWSFVKSKQKTNNYPSTMVLGSDV